MSNQLPPSKFGAGTTYGDTGQAHSLPQTAPPPVTPPPPPVAPPPPPYSVAPDPYATAGHLAPPSADPYAAPGQPTPVPDPYAPQYVTASAGYSIPTRAAGTGAAIPVTAAILSLIGAVWYGIDTILNWNRVEFLFLILDGSPTGWQYGLVVTVIMQFIFVLLLLVGGILLLTRNSIGRVFALLGTALVVAANIYWAIATFDFANSLDASLGTNSPVREDLVVTVLLNIGLPALLAIIAFVLLISGSTTRWCRRSAPAAY